MNRKLLLINPWIYDFTAFDLWSKPLGLLYIASFLRKSGYEIHFVDCLENPPTGRQKNRKYGTGHYQREIIEKPVNLSHVPRHFARYGMPEKDFIKKITSIPRPDAILVTSLMTYWYPGVQRVTELCRELLPGVPVILGGIYASLMPDHAMKTIKPDYLIEGPGEIKLLELLSDLFGSTVSQSDIPERLDEYPYPALDLIKNPEYLLVMTARGCPYNCTFCAQKLISMQFTQRKPDSVVEELKYHYGTYRIRDFAFYDDALFIRKEKHIKVILEKLIQSRITLRLHSPNGLFANYIDPDLAELMYLSGFKTIRLSFETSNETRRKDMYSKVSNKGMIEAVANLVKAGFKASELDAYVLMGLPDQSFEEVLASIIFVHNLGVQVRLASFSPIPGTKEFEKAVDIGYIKPDVDPLLTNKTIFPLSDERITYEMYRKLRKFAQILNQASQSGIAMFDHSELGSAVKSLVREMD
jgi:radical SAM superfamily enzyme YgiQ (UPF0313 family)